MSVERKGTKEGDTRLSHSSSVLLMNCTQKYFHRKIAGTPPDSDVEEDRRALDLGSAFHNIVEQAKHDNEPTAKMVKHSAKSYKVEDSMPLLHAMAMKYFKLHKKSGLKCAAIEFEISDPSFIGYVDTVLVDAKGGWWISDLKTASTISELKLARLHTDAQLNKYCKFFESIAKTYGLDPKKFKGARYRVTTKSKLKPLADEAYGSYVKRLFKSVQSIDVVIPKELLNWEKAYEVHKKLHALSMKLREGKIKPRPNYDYCDSYFKPCEYWSACHGKPVSQLKEALQVIDAD